MALRVLVSWWLHPHPDFLDTLLLGTVQGAGHVSHYLGMIAGHVAGIGVVQHPAAVGAQCLRGEHHGDDRTAATSLGTLGGQSLSQTLRSPSFAS